jgi:hypothetical protein
MNDPHRTDPGRRAVALAALCAALAATPGCLAGLLPATETATNAEAEKDKSLAAGATGAREMLVVGQLKSLRTNEEGYYAQHGRYATTDELVSSGLMNRQAGAAGYVIEVTPGGSGYTVTATPKTYGPDGKRSFFMDETGTIRGADHGGEPATASDPVV